MFGITSHAHTRNFVNSCFEYFSVRQILTNSRKVWLQSVKDVFLLTLFCFFGMHAFSSAECPTATIFLPWDCASAERMSRA